MAEHFRFRRTGRSYAREGAIRSCWELGSRASGSPAAGSERRMRVALTGDAFFLRRHKGLASALSKRLGALDVVPSGNILELLPFRILSRVARGPFARPIQKYLQSFDRKGDGYAIRSCQTERKLLRLSPDYTLHLFSSFAPVWEARLRFGMYLDYTMALAARCWPAWAAFQSPAERNRWLELEKRSYEQAETLFSMSSMVASSLVEDYGIAERKIRVVGSATDIGSPPDGERTFGSKLILFYGSEWERKGGDVMVDAFQKVRTAIPSASLVIVGDSPRISAPGVSTLGVVSHAKLRELFLAADVVAAPARCEPFTTFVIEAMSFGTPCLVTRASGISEQVHGGGVVLERLASDLLAGELVSLLEDPDRLAAMSRSARGVVADTLNWESVSARIAAAI
jgi:glycogen synthase